MKNKKKVLEIVLSSVVSLIGVFLIVFGLYMDKYYYIDEVYFAPVVTEFSIEDTLSDGNGRKAHIILLAGQSNASGASWDSELKKNVSVDKYEEYANGYDNVYINHFNGNGNNVSGGFVKTNTNQGEITNFFGPEVGIAEKLHELYPNELFFIVKYAWGATNLYQQWLSPSSFGKTGKLYTAFINFVNVSAEYLVSKNYDVSIDAMCWMQGESDSGSIVYANRYEKNTRNLIKDVRNDLDKHIDNQMIFVDAYIADSGFWPHYKTINKCKKAVSDESRYNKCIDTISVGLTYDKEPEGSVDMAHYDSLSQIRLGHLFAENIEV